MTSQELTKEIFEAQRLAIKGKNGIHLKATFVLQDGEKVTFEAVDGKFDSVMTIGANGVEVYEHGSENPIPDRQADKNIFTTPHVFNVIPFSEIRTYSIAYDTLRKQSVTDEEE